MTTRIGGHQLFHDPQQYLEVKGQPESCFVNQDQLRLAQHVKRFVAGCAHVAKEGRREVVAPAAAAHDARHGDRLHVTGPLPWGADVDGKPVVERHYAFERGAVVAERQALSLEPGAAFAEAKVDDGLHPGTGPLSQGPARDPEPGSRPREAPGIPRPNGGIGRIEGIGHRERLQAAVEGRHLTGHLLGPSPGA